MNTSTPATATATEWMAAMIASLADNKALLGRRYSDWAISAPTLESAVAAAAMAQDELGHARSTYPVLKALGAADEDEEASFCGSRHLALLDQEFADWTEFVAANLVVDGTLTTFVAACQESAIGQMAQRAKKILQEEGSHRVHGEAWARRLCAEPASAEALAAGVRADWEEASRWLGPGDDSGAGAALEQGLLGIGVADQRRRVREWLNGLFADGGVELGLTEPEDWSGWDSASRRLSP
jgi:1,2-phenylacetyl-CoA epoxidase catalytic subunit